MRVLLPWKKASLEDETTTTTTANNQQQQQPSSPHTPPSALKRRSPDDDDEEEEGEVEASLVSDIKRSRLTAAATTCDSTASSCFPSSSSNLDSKPAARPTNNRSMTAGGLGGRGGGNHHNIDNLGSSAPSSSSSPLVQQRHPPPPFDDDYLDDDTEHNILENEPHRDYQQNANHRSYTSASSAAAAAAASSRDASSSSNSTTSNSTEVTAPCDGCGDEGEEEDLASSIFAQSLKHRGLEIVQQEGDGNCLFRAVALQVYGDAAAHAEVRRLCCDFMAKDPEHFGEFIVAEQETYEEYIARKRQDGVHGNNPELQALCELFNRPLEVYTPEAGADKPINIFHGDYKTCDVPIRLSYHDGNHYNAVINPILPTAGLGLGLPGLQPGLADKLQVAQALTASDELQDEVELQRVVQESQNEYQRASDDALQRALKESAFSMDHMYKDKALVLSDVDATNFELEQTVLEHSMLQEHGRKQRARISSTSCGGGTTGTSSSTRRHHQRGQRDDVTAACTVADDEMLVPPASLVPAVASSAAAARAPSTSTTSRPAASSSTPSTTSASASSPHRNSHSPLHLQDAMEYPETVQELAMNGFELSRVVRAYELVGDNFDDLLAFLMAQQ